MQWRVRVASAFAAGALLLGVPTLGHARAQSPTPTPATTPAPSGSPAPAASPSGSLSAKLITADALPGWRKNGTISFTIGNDGTISTGDSDTANARLIIAENLFTPTDQGKALIVVALMQVAPGINVEDLTPEIDDGTLLRSLAGGATQNTTTDVTLQGPQGVGEHDQSATFSGTLNGVDWQFAGDTSLRNGLIAITVYGGDASQTDAPTALTDAVNVAQIEDALLQTFPASGGGTTTF